MRFSVHDVARLLTNKPEQKYPLALFGSQTAIWHPGCGNRLAGKTGVYDNAAAETVMGLFKNEAVAKHSPFRSGALKTESDVVEVVFDSVHWYNNARLHSSLGHQTPEEFERIYYDENSGSLLHAAAHKTAA
ncbi:integrase core domain-containing protein [Paeniglutamicibacter sp. ZC-3]|uniref:integrase core domain-containing protein n=1 Tax=Paeniglutamicibacter sp. ZC-3 TaxID=2986919 RepID=UPI0021F6DA74|nr:integrase core domain-containing protein [Paeniglutamicibacter sp. ZC-3]MCV9993431.1 integrase core domain-containing protein [Paeniglutamicibacter sp. ZC-3]